MVSSLIKSAVVSYINLLSYLFHIPQRVVTGYISLVTYVFFRVFYFVFPDQVSHEKRSKQPVESSHPRQQPQQQQQQQHQQDLRQRRTTNAKVSASEKQVSTSLRVGSEPIVETTTIVKDPIIEEVVKEYVVIEKQPIIHRLIERHVTHHVEVHSEEHAPSLAGVLQRAPIIQETVHTTETTEVQPVIHKEKAVQRIEQVEKHLSERVVEPTEHIYEETFDAPKVAKVAVPVIVENKPAKVLAPVIQPTTYERIDKDVVFEKSVRTDKFVEVQPIIHRDVYQNKVIHVEDHHLEKAAPSLAGVVEKAPIILDSFHQKVINEITPVIHKERAEVRVEKEQIHLTENVVQPEHVNETQYEKSAFVLEAAKIVEDKPAVVARTYAPVEKRSITNDAIVDEKIRTDTLVEVQPVIARDHQKEVVRHITKHTTEVAPSKAAIIEKAPIIEETVHTTDVTEIKRIVHQEDAIREVEKREEHIADLERHELDREYKATLALNGKQTTEKELQKTLATEYKKSVSQQSK